MVRVLACRAIAIVACVSLLSPTPASALLQPGPPAGAKRVRVSGLSDVAFGTITNFGADYVRNQDVCLFAHSPPPPHTYRITVSGSGSGGALNLNSGSNTLPYEVQWSDTAGQTSGTQLLANVPLTNQGTGASNDDCSNGPAATASLIIILRSAAVAGSISGSYSGSLTLLVAPE